MANIRIKCAQIVQTVLEDKVFFGDLKTQIAAKDLPFANMLILTALRHWVGLSRLLNSFLNKKIPNKHRTARYLILLAMTELLFMQTAPYAVINETVKNVRQTTDLFLSRLSNAVLRQVAAQAEELRQKLAGESHLPEDFTAILSGYDAATIKQIDDCITNIPALDLSVKENPRIWAKKLSAELLPSGSLRLSANANVPLLKGYHEGAWWVQDAAAALPVLSLGNVAGKKVADLCAAPGGKTAQLAAKGADITAIDISADRLKTLQQNMQRIDFEKVQTFCADAIDFLQKTPEQFDALLLDAPCSATGTFRRHPEVLHLKTIADV
ncbi:MAG: methyltransferase domain-containing protein, partial [Alphaproteobacteria bacterium]|nr:methyltransferase domain-containing protein [Alphaproteobacteria bacterium]